MTIFHPRSQAKTNDDFNYVSQRQIDDFVFVRMGKVLSTVS